jgi:hypothetical protein
VGVVSELLAAGAQIEARDKVSDLCSVIICLNDSLSSVRRMDSPPSCLLSRSCGGGDSVGDSESSSGCSR